MDTESEGEVLTEEDRNPEEPQHSIVAIVLNLFEFASGHRYGIVGIIRDDAQLALTSPR